MTIEELDALFPNRRAELEAMGLDPNVLRIPRRLGQRWTPEQCRAVFPEFGDVWRDVLAKQGLVQSESEPDKSA